MQETSQAEAAESPGSPQNSSPEQLQPEQQAKELHAEQLHAKFRTIIMLLTLVTAVNNGGQSILVQQQGPAKDLKIALDSANPTRDNTMNSVASIMVRNGEVVATAGHYTTNGSTTHVQVFAAQDGLKATDPQQAADGADSKINFPIESASFTAIINPEKNFGKKRIGDGHYKEANQGKPHWDPILKEDWTSLLEIP
jgi:hypothetical protein